MSKVVFENSLLEIEAADSFNLEGEGEFSLEDGGMLFCDKEGGSGAILWNMTLSHFLIMANQVYFLRQKKMRIS